MLCQISSRVKDDSRMRERSLYIVSHDNCIGEVTKVIIFIILFKLQVQGNFFMFLNIFPFCRLRPNSFQCILILKCFIYIPKMFFFLFNWWVASFAEFRILNSFDKKKFKAVLMYQLIEEELFKALQMLIFGQNWMENEGVAIESNENFHFSVNIIEFEFLRMRYFTNNYRHFYLKIV